MAQATRRRGAGGQRARRKGRPAHPRASRDRPSHAGERPDEPKVENHRSRPGHHGKSTRSLGDSLRESGFRRAAQETMTHTYVSLIAGGVSTRHAAAPTPAVAAQPAPDPVNKLTDLERRRVLEVLTSDRFVDLAPLQIYAQL